MFWGLNLKPNRKYTQKTARSFHISSAALDITTSIDDEPIQLFINSDNDRFLICTLSKEGPQQVQLDLNFDEGEEICFNTIGTGNVTLAGYISENDPFLADSGDIADQLDLRAALNAKRGKGGKAAITNTEDAVDSEDDPDLNGIEDMEKVLDGMEDEDDDDDLDMDDEEDDEDDVDEEDDEEDDDEEEEEDDDEEEDEEDDEDDDDEEEDEEEKEPVSLAKRPKLDTSTKQQNGTVAVVKKQNAKNKKENTKNNKKENAKEKPAAKVNAKQNNGNGGEKTITGGVKIIDLREGNGSEAKVGKRVQVYYEGRFKSNNKVFDSLKTGAGFKFRLGSGEVIKAWDVGCLGMKVGGRRRIIAPPHMAYGAKGVPPSIPPNSTLVFEVELKSVN